jgi:formylglycine-generating enzyme required for sulfatase activity
VAAGPQATTSDLQGETSPDRIKGAPPPAPVSPQGFRNSIGMVLVVLPAGTFLMGSPSQEEEHQDNEWQHEVEITRPFGIGIYPVTQEEYEKVMGTNPSHFSIKSAGKDRVRGMDTRRFPVENVRWDDAMEFCHKLSERPEEKQAGRQYRLPTEAEWEYACRGGASQSAPFYFDGPVFSLSSQQANFNGRYPYGGAPQGPNKERTEAVGFCNQPNGFGLHDMHGNVWEWCADCFDKDYYRIGPRQDPCNDRSGTLRVVRGGSWNFQAKYCRAAERSGFVPGARSLDVGFRVVCVPVSRTH